MILRQRIDNFSGRPFSEIANDVENLIGHVFGESQSHDSMLKPRVNILESDDRYTVQLELPGIQASDVNVEVKEGALEVTGEKKEFDLPEGTTLLRTERSVGKFRRSFNFEQPLNSEQISATFKLGVLTIELPKAEQILPKKIQINVEE